MSSTSIELSEAEDTMIWYRDEKRGIPTTKVTYIAMLEYQRFWVSNWCYKQVWKGNFPLKIKCFLWLALQNKFLTQDNFQKRGGIIVNCCILCGATLETLDHLLVLCPFTCLVCSKVLLSLNLESNWGKSYFSVSLQNWFHMHKISSFKYLASPLSWNLWKLRNAIFLTLQSKVRIWWLKELFENTNK